MPVVSYNLGAVPPEGLWEFYVDAATGDDDAAGTSWSTAWRTCRGAIRNLASIYALLPRNLQTLVRMRGTFDPDDPLIVDFQAVPPSSICFACDPADSPTVKSGRVTSIDEHSLPACGLLWLELNSTPPLSLSDEGKLIVFSDGTNVCTFQILFVDPDKQAVRISTTSGDIPGWVVPGVTFRVIGAGARIPAGIGVTDVSGQDSVALLNIATSFALIRGGNPCLALVSDLLRIQNSSLTSVVPRGCPADQWLPRLGFSVGPESYCRFGCDCLCLLGYEVSGDNAKGIVGKYGDVFVYGGTLQMAFVSVRTAFVVSPEFVGIRQAVIGSDVSSTAVVCVGGGTVECNGASVLRTPGMTPAVLLAAYGSTLIVSMVEGENNGFGPADMYGVAAIRNGHVQVDGFSANAIRGRDGRFVVDHGSITVDESVEIGPSLGGADFLVFDGLLQFQSSMRKTAVNSVGGGLAGPVLRVDGGGRVFQFGGFFQLPEGTGNYEDDYGPQGAIYLARNARATLGELSGGTVETTGVGCWIRRGSSLVHEGLGLSGVAPIVIGADGLPGGRSWPAVSTSDSRYLSNELCLCCTPTTSGGLSPSGVVLCNNDPGAVSVGDAVYVKPQPDLPNTVARACAGAPPLMTPDAIGLVIATPTPTTCLVVTTGLATIPPPISPLVQGATYYLGLSPGEITPTAPTVHGQKVQEIGVAVSPTELLVHIDPTSVLL